MSDHAHDLRAWLAPRAGKMAELLEELVAIDTENPPGRALGRCGWVLHGAMGRLGLAPELIEVASVRELEEPCVVRGAAGQGDELVYFHGHFDVVPAQYPNQFEPYRRRGSIVGRGSADMKGGLVSMLYGAAAAAELGLLEGRRIVLHCVCDEETGSEAGSGYLRRAGQIDAGALAMLTAEPTGGAVWHACRGAITLRVEVAGREAHVGCANEGVNAFEHMIHIAAPLTTLANQLLQHHTSFPVDSQEAAGSMLVVGGQTGAGVGFNVVPGSAWFSVDRRFNPEEHLDAEIQRLTASINQSARERGARVCIDVLQKQPSGSTEESHPAARTLAACVRSVEGAEPAFRMCPGVLDTRWYSQLGIPAFAYGPGRLDLSHGPSEYVDMDAMTHCAIVYALFAQQVGR